MDAIGLDLATFAVGTEPGTPPAQPPTPPAPGTTPTQPPASGPNFLIVFGIAAVVGIIALVVLAVILLLPKEQPPTLTLSVDQAIVGQSIHVSGTGFVGGEPVDILVQSQVRQTLTAAADGSFAGDLAVPAGAAAPTTPTLVEAVGKTSGRRASATFAVLAPTPTPRPAATLTVTPAAALPFESITLAGTGFDPGEGVAVAIQDQLQPQSAIVAGDGTVKLALTVPADFVIEKQTSTVSIKAIGAASGRSAAVDFVITPPEVVFDGQIALGLDQEVDIDSGGLVFRGVADLTIVFSGNIVLGATTELRPLNGAQQAFMGALREAPGVAGCARAKFSASGITAGGLDPGDYVCVVTNQGQLAEVKVVGINTIIGGITVAVRTYAVTFPG